MYSEILLTGGSGLLGSELLQIAPDLTAPSHEEFDITDLLTMEEFITEHSLSTIIHGAAFTSPPKVDEDPITAMNVNITGTANLVTLAARHNMRLIYISTDYIFKGFRGNYQEDDEVLPQNLYAWSKMGGECAVRMYKNSLILRTSFCESVFSHEKAFVDQFTSRDSVSVIAPMMLKLVEKENLTGVVHVGTVRKSVKDLAQRLGKPEVGDLKRNEVDFEVPFDTSFDLSNLEKILSE
jgi:dTDP-4-dehydrorhamnose reductase